MKLKKLLLPILSLFVLNSCNEFDRDISNVNGEFPLSLGFEFIEPDFGAGDTVTMRSYWSGTPKVDPSTLVWDVSWKFYYDRYGDEVVLERESLQPYIVGNIQEIASATETQIFELKIAIPEDVLVNSPGIPNDWSELLMMNGIDPRVVTIPTTKTAGLAFLDSLAALSPEEQATISMDDGLYYNGISQVHTALFRIFCDNRASGGFNTEVDYSVRYHNAMKDIPGVFSNSAPRTTNRQIFEVKGDVKTFEKGKSTIVKTYDVIDDAVEINLDTSNSYFIVTDVTKRDSTITMNKAFTDKEVSFEQFIQNNNYNSDAFKSIAFEKQDDQPFQHVGVAQSVSKIFFEEDEKPVMNQQLLVRVLRRDMRIGTSYRPEAAAFEELTITLK